MAKKLLILAFFVALTFPAFSQPEKALFNQVQKKYSQSLHFHNQGVVESAIVQLIVLKLRFPEQEMAHIREDLRYLILKGPTSQIRYKAFVALFVIENPGVIKMDAQTLSDYNEAYIAVSGILDRQFMAIPKFTASN